MTLLDTILARKRALLPVIRHEVPVHKLEQMQGFSRTPYDLCEALLNPDRTGIIAEFKRKSPSKGILNDRSTLEEVTTGYFRSGASGLSILTDSEYFGGSAEDLIRARELNPLPILRKDFLVDEYQVIEAKAWGADAVLLIAAALENTVIKQLARLARSLGMQVILEVHSEEELARVNEFVSVVGVNNRDLKDFTVDLNRSMELADKIPSGFLKLSESGIHSAHHIKQLRACGFQGFLIGEHFMHAPDPPTAFAEFINQLL